MSHFFKKLKIIGLVLSSLTLEQLVSISLHCYLEFKVQRKEFLY